MKCVLACLNIFAFLLLCPFDYSNDLQAKITIGQCRSGGIRRNFDTPPPRLLKLNDVNFFSAGALTGFRFCGTRCFTPFACGSLSIYSKKLPTYHTKQTLFLSIKNSFNPTIVTDFHQRTYTLANGTSSPFPLTFLGIPLQLASYYLPSSNVRFLRPRVTYIRVFLV